MYKTTLQLILIWLLIMCFSRCQTAKQLMDKAEKKDPAIVAEYARDKYPCTDLLKPDTAIIWKDTVVYVDCPDTAQTSPYEVTVTDTVTRMVTKTIRVPVTLPVRTQIITKYYEDSAKIKIVMLQIQALQADTARLQAQVNTYKDKLHTRTVQSLWLLGLVIALILWTFRKVILKLFI